MVFGPCAPFFKKETAVETLDRALRLLFLARYGQRQQRFCSPHISYDTGVVELFLHEEPPGNEVVLCLGGLDSFSASEVTWSNLLDYCEKHRGLRLVLLMGKTVRQWEGPDTDWTGQGWTTNPTKGRYWVKKMELKDLLDSRKVDHSYVNIRRRWGKMTAATSKKIICARAH